MKLATQLNKYLYRFPSENTKEKNNTSIVAIETYCKIDS